jgi:hypothetical protein
MKGDISKTGFFHISLDSVVKLLADPHIKRTITPRNSPEDRHRANTPSASRLSEACFSRSMFVDIVSRALSCSVVYIYFSFHSFFNPMFLPVDPMGKRPC